MIWTVVGAGAILPRAGYGCSGYALRPAPGEPVTLFDCGPGTLRSLPALGIELEEVERVVLSHFHPDHCLDLLALAFARRNPRFEGRELEVLGPRGLGEWLEGAARALGRWVALDGARVSEVEPTELPLEVASGASFALRSAWTRHTDTSLAWRAERDGRSVTYSGDAREAEELVRLASGTDLLVCECSGNDEEPMPGHLTPSSAARVARAAGARRLVLTHFYPEVDPERAAEVARRTFEGPVELARDGAVFELG